MFDLSCPSGDSRGLYDRQLDTALFKRLHATNFTLAPKREKKILGPGSYSPLTIEEISRGKSAGKYGRFYQQSQRFPSKYLYRIQEMSHVLSNIPDQRRNNSIRLDRQSGKRCEQRRALAPRAPPVTLYEKSSFVDELQRKQTDSSLFLNKESVALSRISRRLEL